MILCDDLKYTYQFAGIEIDYKKNSKKILYIFPIKIQNNIRILL